MSRSNSKTSLLVCFFYLSVCVSFTFSIINDSRIYFNDEFFKIGIDAHRTFGGRSKSALMRDRAYKSDEPHEQAYSRKRRPKNPKYKKAEEGMEMAGGDALAQLEADLRHGDFEVDVYLADKQGNQTFFNTNSYMNKTLKEVVEGVREAMKGQNKGAHAEIHQLVYMGSVNSDGDFKAGKWGRAMGYSHGGEMHRMDDSSYKKGGTLKNKANYLPQREIESITTWDGNVIEGSDILDGIYVKKRVKI